MDIKHISIPLIRQDPGSDDCLRACAYMAFRYFGDDISKDEVWRKIHVYKKHSGLRGGYHQDLGVLALRKNYEATIFHYDYGWWNEDTAQASKKSDKMLISKLKGLKKEKSEWGDKLSIGKDIKFIKAGGKYNFQLPALKTIDEFLIKRVPVFLIVSEALFYHNPKLGYMHSILIVGKRSNNYIVRDPLYAVKQIEAEELLYCWSNARGWMMVIVPKEKKAKDQRPKARQFKLKF
jgi:uncharacterized protein YvpB